MRFRAGRLTRSRAAVAVIVCCLASGCSATQSGSAASARAAAKAAPSPSLVAGVTSIPAGLTSNDVVLPIDSYMLTVVQQGQWQQTADTLTRQCMARFGFELPTPPGPVDQGLDTYGNQRRYGVPPSLAYARDYGFHFAENDPRSTRMVNDPGWPPAPSADEAAVLRGSNQSGEVTSYAGLSVPRGGCQGQANSQVSSSAMIPTAVSDLSIQSFEQTQADPRVIAAQSAWSKCMAEQGYSYKTSLDAMGNPPDGNGAVASSAEIAVAVADSTCAAQVNLVGLWSAVETAFQRQQIDANAQVFAQALAYVQAEQKKIASVLSGNR